MRSEAHPEGHQFIVQLLQQPAAKRLIEAGPGKHGITQAFFIYLLEPGGNRVELFSGGYQIFAPDWEPIKWTKDEIEKSIIWWGSPLPQEYFIYGT